MESGNRTFLVVVGALALVGAILLARRPGSDRPAQAAAGQPAAISAGDRAAGIRFAADVGAYDRQAVLRAVADARPEARRLIDAVDGLVDLSVEQTQAGVAGTTQLVGARYDVRLNLGLASRAGGQRAIDRLVLHELGHVVDFALVPDATFDALVAQVPAGYGCDDGVTGGCTTPEERFADTFAKWATNDIGVDVALGYKIPPPADLEGWGAPLSRLPV
ncbi:MAG TPA: hypothetical protein VFT50_16145 [Baekduia sp.]|nr:hypothetical protein [Baekduia sp.]